jgi:hypothetical protein
MEALELFDTLTLAGCRLIPDGDTLRVQDPHRALNDELRTAIRQHKAALLALLTEPSAPEAGHTYCPGCRATTLDQQADRTTCTACGAFWLPSIDLATDAPHATIRVTHPETGQVLTVGIYRCPDCRETRWGPRLDRPEVPTVSRPNQTRPRPGSAMSACALG